MSDLKEVHWFSPRETEYIEFINGCYKLISRQEMIPLGRTVEEVNAKLKLLGRNDILESLQ